MAAPATVLQSASDSRVARAALGAAGDDRAGGGATAVASREVPVTDDVPEAEAEYERLLEHLAEASRRLGRLERERDLLLLHARNLERELRRLTQERAGAERRTEQGREAARRRIRELEALVEIGAPHADGASAGLAGLMERSAGAAPRPMLDRKSVV